MKKVFSFILLLFILILTVSAQNKNWGIKFGSGFTNEYNNLVSFEFNAGVEASGFYLFELTERTKIRGEIGIIEKGFRDYTYFTNQNGSFITSTNSYIWLHKFVLGPGIIIIPFEQLPFFYLGLQMNAEYHMGTLVILDNDHMKENMKESYKQVYSEMRNLTASLELDLGAKIKDKYILELGVSLGSDKMKGDAIWNEFYAGLSFGIILN